MLNPSKTWRELLSCGGTNGYKSCKLSSIISISSERRMVGRGDGKKHIYGPPGSRQHEPGVTTSKT